MTGLIDLGCESGQGERRGESLVETCQDRSGVESFSD